MNTILCKHLKRLWITGHGRFECGARVRMLGICCLLWLGAFSNAHAQISSLSGGSVSVNEDTVGTIDVKISAWRGVYNRVSASSGNTSLVPSQSLVVTKIKEYYEFPSQRAEYRISFLPTANAVGSAGITITASDGVAINSSVTVTVNVTQVDDPPVISGFPTTTTILEDGTRTVPFNVSDLEDPVGVNIATGATSSNPALIPNTSGSLRVEGTGNSRNLVITPAANQSGTAVITLRASQASQSVTATMTVTVNAVNDAPTLAVSGGLSQSGSEDTIKDVGVTLGDVDTPVSALGFAVVSSSNPSLLPLTSISVSGVNESRTLRLTPLPNASGTTTVTIRASDGVLSTDASFTFTVSPVNDVPVAGAGWAYQFGPSTGYAELPAMDLANKSFTLEFWAKPSSLNKDRWLVTQGDVGVLDQSLHVGFRANNRFTFAFWGDDLNTQEAYVDTAWHHWACVYDFASNVRTIYRDGLQVATDIPTGVYRGNSRILLGQSLPAAARFEGMLDEVRLWSVARDESQIRSFMNVAIAGSTQGLLGYWRFDEGQNLTVADSGPTRLHGTIRGSATSGYVPRRDDTGLAFDGVNDWVNIPGLMSAAPTTEVTVEFWQRVDEQRSQATFAIEPDNLNARFLAHVPFQDGVVYWDFGSILSGGRLTYTPTDIVLGKWEHWAMVASQSGNYMRIFRNGQLVASKAGMSPFTRQNAALVLGRAGAAYFKGGMDEFRIWNVARTPDQIQGGMQARLSGTEPGLFLYYPMNERNSAVILDRSPGGRNGALIGGPVFGLPDSASNFDLWVVNEDVTTPIYLPGYDADLYRAEAGSTLTFTIVNPPTHGTLNQTSGDWANASRNPVLYTPDADYNGPDSFTYRLSDNTGATSQLYTMNLVVQALNDPPIIAPIPDRTILENTSSGAISVTVTDEDHDPAVIQLSVFLDPPNNSIIPLDAAHVILGGTGSARTLTLIPAEDQIGTVTVTIRARDPGPDPKSSERSFKLRVDPKPAYALVDLGEYQTRVITSGSGVNDAGWTVGYAQTQDSDRRAVLLRGLNDTTGFEDLGTLGGNGSRAEALGINLLNQVVGYTVTSAGGLREAFLWKDETLTSLRPTLVALGDDSVAFAINDTGDYVGSYRLAQVRRGFRTLVGTAPVSLVPPFGRAQSEAYGVNGAGIAVGVSFTPGVPEVATYWSNTNNVGVSLGVPISRYSSRAVGVNDSGIVVGYSVTSSDPATAKRQAFAYQLPSGPFTELGFLTGGSNSVAAAINSFGQIVGTATKGGTDGAGVSVAFLRTAGVNYDLNDLIHDGHNFKFDAGRHQLREAKAISRNGTIVGTGNLDGQDHAFMAVPAWVIGRPIAAPEGAVTRIPEIEILEGNADDSRQNAFAWSAAEKRLYAIRPVTARLKWFKSFDDLIGSGTNVSANLDRIVTVGISVWPKVPTYHVAGSPVFLESGVEVPDYTYQSIAYTAPGATPVVDPTSKTFNASSDGFTVLHYLKTQGSQPSPSTQSPYYEVVHTVLWDNPKHLQERSAVVGEALSDSKLGEDPGHQEWNGRNGYVVQELAPYDGAGPDRAYDRATRLGDIIPVNLDTASKSDDLVVAWYRLNRIGVAWAERPVRYSLSWPADESVAKIIIASELGSGALAPAEYPSPRVYRQDDRALPGFNPNEEHALLAPVQRGSGQALFALRNDLNARISPKASDPYALLKHRDPVKGGWRIKVFKVLADSEQFPFRFSATAGKEIQPPHPLELLQPYSALSKGVEGPWWRDYKDRLYARAAGPEGSGTNVVIQWFYPLQPDFYYDISSPVGADAAVGDPVAWLDRRTAQTMLAPNQDAGVAGTPIDVTYAVTWPDAKVLQIGETLMDSKGDLPSIMNMAKVESIYDDLSPTWDPLADGSLAPIATLARLYDPLSIRSVPLPDGYVVPTSIKQLSRGGKVLFADLPQTLQWRFKYDPDLNALTFGGVYDAENFIGGEPLLLPNVLTSREVVRLKALASADGTWTGLVDKLFALTRNPNQVDVDGGTNGAPDGKPDEALRIGLVNLYTFNYLETKTDPGSLKVTTNTVVANTYDLSTLAGLQAARVIATNVVAEPLGSQPKALTAGLGGIPAGVPRPGNALSMDGVDDRVDLGSTVDLSNRPLTVEFWARKTVNGRATAVVSQGDTATPGAALRAGFQFNDRFVFTFGGRDLEVTTPTTDSDWHHWACVYDQTQARRHIYRDGLLVATETNAPAYSAQATMWLGYSRPLNTYFGGEVDEVRIWRVAKSSFAIARDRSKRLTGNEDGLVRYFRCDEANGSVLIDASGAGQNGVLGGNAGRVVSNAKTGVPPRYLTLVENNDASLGSSPVTLYILRVEDGPFLGDLKALLPENAFDERLTIRHSNDFGADPDPLAFEWYYHPADETYDPLNPAMLPQVSATGAISNPNGWVLYKGGFGLNDVTLGESGESGIFAITDNYWIGRYRGYAVGLQDTNTWSDWVGDPGGKSFPIPLLGEGWVKRVVRSLNPFDQRTKDFHANSVSTYSSMIVQAGPRYEGPIAMNPSADNLNSVGLIETYSTVLDIARGKSIDAAVPVNYTPANTALLNAASRISELYMLLGNEAYSDAIDPTIGFGTSSGEYGTLASSIFAFQNQMDSLIDEELALLRGRDLTGGGVQARPAYNRLLWNYTLGEGEVAYQQTYNIFDQNKDGFVDERDARVQYPQGHGDAWGHYLTAITTYYELMQHPFFTWIPQAETLNVGGQLVRVDYQDERKFARAAAMRAKTGRDIVNLTYRRFYVDDPAGQWQGYKDTDLERAWGVSEWATRSFQGAYFDWLAVNSILPSQDPNPSHTGIQKVDRQTVRELSEMAAQAGEIQSILDQADEGLNPLGLAKGAVPFDIDPTFLEVGSTAQIGRRAVQGLTQFDQILERAIAAMKNAVNVWDQANRATELLRKNQDSENEFSNNLADQELDFKNRLIEIFGYPYAGDIGPGKTYPTGYDGPDYYHYMYVDNVSVDTATAPISEDFMAYFKPIETEPGSFRYTFNADSSVPAPEVLETEILPVLYPLSAGDYGFKAPSNWGARRAPGELQIALSDCVQANASLLDALQNYCGLIADIKAQVELLEAQKNLNSSILTAKQTQLGLVTAVNVSIAVMNAVETNLRRVVSVSRDLAEALKEGMPRVFGLATDVTAPIRGIVSSAVAGSTIATEVVADNLAVAQNAMDLSKEVIGLSTDLAIDVKSQDFEVLQRIKEIEHMMRDEYNLRIRAYQEAEVVRQNLGRYKAMLAAGQRLLEERKTYRARAAAATSRARYEDMTFRIFRNDAIQKYRAAFDLAAKYVYLAANAYDFEVNFGVTDPRAASRFLTDIVRQRSLGQIVDGSPAVGQPGLADSLARMEANWAVLKTQFGVIQPQIADTRFSLREELFRVPGDGASSGDEAEAASAGWKRALTEARVADLWSVPEFRRFCRPFAPESAGPQPGIVIRFSTKIEFGLNYFGWPLSGGDSAYDPSQYSTKIARAGVWLSGSDGTRVSQTPRVYLVPVGLDVMRVPTGSDLATREFRIVDQVVPAPFPIGASDMKNPGWIPAADSLGGSFTQIRRYGAMSARHDGGIYAEADLTNDTRLIGRSAWNTDWLLIIPGGTLLNDPNRGIQEFIDSVSDIKIYFQTYSYSGL